MAAGSSGGRPLKERPSPVLVTFIALAAVAPALSTEAESEEAADTHFVERLVTADAPGCVRVRLDLPEGAAMLPAGARPLYPGELHVHAPDGSLVEPTAVRFSPSGNVTARVSGIEELADGWHIVLDLGPFPVRHRRLHLELEGSFVASGAELEAGGDLVGWTPLDTSDLFRLGSSDVVSRLAIDYAPSSSRFLRLRWPASAGLPRLEAAHVETSPQGEPPAIESARGGPKVPVAWLLPAAPGQDLALGTVELPASGLRLAWLVLDRPNGSGTSFSLWDSVYPPGRRLASFAGTSVAGGFGITSDTEGSRAVLHPEPDQDPALTAWLLESVVEPDEVGIAFAASRAVDERLTLIWRRTPTTPSLPQSVRVGFRPAWIVFEAPAAGTYMVADGMSRTSRGVLDEPMPEALAAAHPCKEVESAATLKPAPTSRQPREPAGPAPERATRWKLIAPLARPGELVRVHLDDSSLDAVDSPSSLRVAAAGRLLPSLLRRSASPTPRLPDIAGQREDAARDGWRVRLDGRTGDVEGFELIFHEVDPASAEIELSELVESRPGIPMKRRKIAAASAPAVRGPLFRLALQPRAFSSRLLELIVDRREGPDAAPSATTARDWSLLEWTRAPEIVFVWPVGGGAELVAGFDAEPHPFPSFEADLARERAEPTSAVVVGEMSTPPTILPFDPRWLFAVSLAIAAVILLFVLRHALARSE
jgi:hypothetical protein